MFRSKDVFLRYFDSVNRRDMRDIGALPPEADGWTPQAGQGENAWSINTIIGHMCGARLYFASAYRGEGWISPEPPDVSSRDKWLPALATSAAELRERIESTPDEWLDRKIEMIDSEGALTGWRVLMMMLEHDVHHRSQIDTYAGMNGWDVPDIFNRSAEHIMTKQDEQRAKFSPR